MTFEIEKGQSILLDKDKYDLSRITIGLGWDVRKKEKKGFLGNLFNEEFEFDLDAIAFLLDENDKIDRKGKTITTNSGQKVGLIGSDVIFFNNMQLEDNTVFHTGDNLSGTGDGDDEQIIVKLDMLEPRIHKIVFLTSIFEGIKKKQHFGLIENAFIRAVDALGHTIVAFRISDNPEFSFKRSLIFAEVFREDDHWRFRAVGKPFETDNFINILKEHYL